MYSKRFSYSTLMELEFLDSFSRSTQKSNFMKILPVGAQLFHADRRTDMTKLIVAFGKLANAPENKWYQ